MIHGEGVCALSEALKTNTTLTVLNLWGEQKGEYIHSHAQQSQRAGNRPRYKGKKALRKALKANTALTVLDI